MALVPDLYVAGEDAFQDCTNFKFQIIVLSTLLI